ncbi:MAG: hypothetical protein AAF560_03940 [Acidobacteriota bacterium]
MTVLYGDLFDYPLTKDEIQRYLVTAGSQSEIEASLGDLQARFLSEQDGLYCLRGREATIATRKQRRQMAAERWPQALRFGRWLSRVPFLRMVAVCGSQAMENGDRDGDIDLFLITAPGRLWLVQSLTMTLRRAGHWLGVELCPNYLLTTRTLQLSERNLYTAREVAQVMPLWGEDAYGDFQAANSWVASFLPQREPSDRCRWLTERPRHRTTAVLEWLLGGVLGDALDRGIHRLLLVYYRLRLRRHGWGREQIERRYQRERQTVITGGFATAVSRRFIDRGCDVLAGAVSRDELERCFFGSSERTAASQPNREEPDPLYAGLLATRYGGGQ